MAEHEWQDNLGTWSFRSLIESAKLDRMTRNDQAAHANKPRANLQLESTYTDDDSYQTVNLFEAEYSCLLWGVRCIGPPEIGSSTGLIAEVDYPSGPGLPPFLRKPVAIVTPAAFYVPDANGGSQWQTADLGSAVDLVDLDNWLLAGIGKPTNPANNMRYGLAIAVRSAGFMDGITPTAAAQLPAGWIYVFFHVTGAVGAY